jgi:hypothetical protein
MIDMVRRHEIQVLRRARRSLVETAKQVISDNYFAGRKSS